MHCDKSVVNTTEIHTRKQGINRKFGSNSHGHLFDLSILISTVKLWSEKLPNYSAHQINLYRKGIKKMRKTIVIFSASKARELLKNGFEIIDIKPHKNDPTKKQSFFVFKYDEKIENFI